MITVTNVSLNFNGTNLFAHCDLMFTKGNCYGIIGANGAGKSTFLRLLSGELEASTGDISIDKKARMSVLKQDHFAYDQYTVLDTIIMGNPRLYEIMKQKDGLYAKEEFTDEDGLLASELEGEFAELNGWESESEASRLIQGLGLDVDTLHMPMSSLDGNRKVKVLLAQALFGSPDILLMDEPTNHLDISSIEWLENFLFDFPGTVLVVSHDRHFLNTVCTHIVDIDFSQMQTYVGNYDFWYESSQLIQRMKRDQNKKAEEKAKELRSFIERFSANKSKAKQATSRKKLLEKLDLDQMPASSRRYPFIGFQIDREPGKEILTVENLCKTVDGEQIIKDLSFRVNKGDKIAFIGDNETAITTLFKILMSELEPDSGSFKWGISTSQSYFPKDNTAFFIDRKLSILKWLEQYSKDVTETYLRGFLGRMLFSGDDVLKPVNVLSGGEKVRCMFSRMMLNGSNVLVVDQPTNHLDLESITAVNNGLSDFKGIVLFSSHDHQFIQTVANRIIELTPNGFVDKVSTYDDYIESTKVLK
ncbi:MAG: ABC transporter ATP-binding protein [Clostridiales bacterium GWF2_38_85]|nr:MAG: ABC transporter ATP-binding protein [Clostridiales bacterium GWF2_38_85]HBL85208.1 ABC transporter ATP-binding protein [Clostridiales bacterium]